MPHKKAKADKSKKTGKPSKPVAKAAKGGMGDALKNAAKKLARKTVGNLTKKAHPAPTAKKAGKAAHPPKKTLLVKGKAEHGSGHKDKKIAKHPPAPAHKPEKAGKKKAEVVVEVPAPKGVALLGREKKKGKSAEAQAAAGKRRCREPGCDHEALIHGYCRLHYIKNWRKIKRKEAILASGQLNNYVEELVNKYPDKYLDVIRQDLASEKEWAKVVVDLELESADEEAGAEEDLDAVAEGVRPAAGGRGGEFEGDDDSF
jgi:hypothetical protein